jgi:pimeloyl-ACP methyl ester carboxylesterase
MMRSDFGNLCSLSADELRGQAHHLDLSPSAGGKLPRLETTIDEVMTAALEFLGASDTNRRAPAASAAAARPDLVPRLKVVLAGVLGKSDVPTLFVARTGDPVHFGLQAIAVLSEVPLDALHRGNVSESQFEEVLGAAKSLHGLPIFFCSEEDGPEFALGRATERFAHSTGNRGVVMMID